MRGIGLEDIILVRIANHNREPFIVSSRIFPRVFLRIGLKFPSDREDFHSEMYILLSLVLFGSYGRGVKVGNK